MFKENTEHDQIKLISFLTSLPKGVLKTIEASWAKPFYKYVFRKIDESKFKPLYSDKGSRPNKPANILVGLEVIKQLFNYSDEELIESFHTDLRTMYALGLTDPGDVSIAIRTIYYFRERLVTYDNENNTSLIKEVLKDITLDLSNDFGIDLNIQRMDSSLIEANIKALTRLNLFARIIYNFLKILPKEELMVLPEELISLSSLENLDISYRLKNQEVEERLKCFGEYCYLLYEKYKDNSVYNTTKEFLDLARLLKEQINISGGDSPKIELKLPKEISSSSIQNPSDSDATYRFKDGNHKGYVGNFAESCSTENAFQLITEAEVKPNNTSDQELLISSLLDDNSLVKEASDLLTDGAYLGKAGEDLCSVYDLDLHVSAIKGPKSDKNNQNLADVTITNNVVEKCPAGKKPFKQKYDSVKKNYSGRFRKEDCLSCPFLEECFVNEQKNCYTYFFREREYYVKKRKKKLKDSSYREFLKLRAGAESMVYMMFFKSGKRTKFRGLARVKNAIIFRAIGVNLLRLRHYIIDMNRNIKDNSVIFYFEKIFSEYYRFFIEILKFIKIYFIREYFSNKYFSYHAF